MNEKETKKEKAEAKRIAEYMVEQVEAHYNEIKRRIRNGELIGYEFVDDYPGIGEALVLKFNTEPHIRPIRPHRYGEYVGVLVEWNRRKEEAEHEDTMRL